MELETVRIIVTGSREWTDRHFLYKILDEKITAGFTLVKGDCPTGTDIMSENWWWMRSRQIDISMELYRAEWKIYGRPAGPRRNKEMVDGGAVQMLAFLKLGAGNRGTTNCMNLGRAAGIPVETYEK